MTSKKTFSFLIRWNDMDLDQGEFGVTVRATNHDEAETLARAEMRACHIENYGDEGVEEYEQDDGTFGGSVIDSAEGAIWKAKELEEALRALLSQCDDIANRQGWPDNGPRNKARAILGEIDKIGAEG